MSGSQWIDKVDLTQHFLDLRSLMVKKKSTKKTKPKTTKPNPCWEGYEPVPGKKSGTKGSCRLKKNEI